MDKVYNIQEIRKFFETEKPRYVALKNPEGKFEVPYNSPGMKPAARFAEIEKALQKKSIPDGVYWFLYRNNLAKTVPEYSYPVAKGNVSLAEIKKPEAVIQTRADEVWTSTKAVEILSQKNKTELILEMRDKELEHLKKENEALQAQLQEDDEDDDSGIDSKTFMDGLNKLAETFAPIIDKHFQLTERKLALQEKQAGVSRQQLQGKQAVNELREDGGVRFDSPDYPTYFNNIYIQNNDDLLNYELDLLEQNNSELYQTICKQFNIEEEQDDGQ